MIFQKEEGYIFKSNSNGKFIQRTLNRGNFDKTHYAIRLVDTPEMATIFDKPEIDNPYNLEYRTIFADAFISGSSPVKIRKVWNDKIFGKVEFVDE